MAEFQWNPARLLQEEDSQDRYALLVLNQPLKNSSNLRRLWKNGMSPGLCSMARTADRILASVRVAADGGANRLHAISTFHGKFVRINLAVCSQYLSNTGSVQLTVHHRRPRFAAAYRAKFLHVSARAGPSNP